ncbi:hypothetical protein CLCR_09288 [Cladophialophora carrionii]|uniref:Uncharacterized protein n=1 Tax=Cladophialophora carrionii TaxID=86049 RepID=A0A1C1CTJ5_9EURO|nr:hypothetical protein CLCR_09288 [Cladophialophora carrionii]
MSQPWTNVPKQAASNDRSWLLQSDVLWLMPLPERTSHVPLHQGSVEIIVGVAEGIEVGSCPDEQRIRQTLEMVVYCFHGVLLPRRRGAQADTQSTRSGGTALRSCRVNDPETRRQRYSGRQ